MKKIKTFIPEIIVSLVLIAIVVGFAIVTNKLHTNSVYDGNYKGGNSTKAFVDVDVKWIPSISEAPGVNNVLFNKNDIWGPKETEEFLNEDGWYLISYVAKINMESGYYERAIDNLLIPDSWNSDDRELYILEVEDGKGFVTKITDYVNDGDSYIEEDMEIVYPVNCDMYFTNNGAAFYVSDYDTNVGLYLEKNGELTAYNYQIIQACLIGAFTVIGLGFIIFFFMKNRVISIAIVFVIAAVMIVFAFNAVKDNIGEWRSIENENEFVIFPKHDENEYIKISGDVKVFEDIYRDYVNEKYIEKLGEECLEEYNPKNKDFKADYKRFDVIPGYATYPFVLCLDIVAALLLGVLCLDGRKKGVVPSAVSANWSYPYGEYNISGIKYLSDAFKGMEDYFMANISQSKVKFMLSYFAFEDVEIENPQYIDVYQKASLYPGAPEEKIHILTIKDSDEEIEYDICVTKTGNYVRKKMENEILIVYEI